MDLAPTQCGNQTEKNSKFRIGWRGLPQVSFCDQLGPSWMSAITRNYKNGCHGSTIEDEDLQQQTPTIPKFGSVFNLNMLLAILDVSHYQKSQKMAAITTL